MKRHAIVLLASLVLVPALAAAQAPAGGPDQKEWVALFNGKNLDGWIPKITGYDAGENFGNTFRVEDGVLKVAYDQYDTFDDRFGHLFYKKPFSHYVLAVEYRFVGEQAKGGPGWAFRNSGVMIHGQPTEDHAARTRTSPSPSRCSSSAAAGTASAARPRTSARRARTW